jgi:hypothetical protein
MAQAATTKKKNPTAKQLAWRKKFAKLVKSGAFAKKAVRTRRRNIAEGFYDASGFHPIRGSADYKPFRAGETPKGKHKAAQTRRRKASLAAAKGSLSRRKKNPVSVVKNGNRLYGAAAQAVLKSRKKKVANSSKSRSKKAVGRAIKRGLSFGQSRALKKRSTKLSMWGNRRKSSGTKTRSTRLSAWNPRRRKRNSASSTSAAYAEFQGRPATATIDVLIPDNAPTDVYVLGGLTEIKTTLDEIEFDDGDAYLLASKTDDLVIGATRTTNSAFEPNEFLGEIKEISYLTTKSHMEDEPIEYVHKLGEEGGQRPALITNEKCQLEIVGGDYWIDSAGIHD